MTHVYRISLKTIHPFNNNPVRDLQVRLNRKQLEGIAIMATAMLGHLRDEVFDIRDHALRTLNLDKIIDQSHSVVIRDAGEVLFDLKPMKNVHWLQLVNDAVIEANQMYGHDIIEITKPYTVKIDASDYYLLQFDDPEFLEGMKYFLTLLGQKDPTGYIKYLHQNNYQLE